MRSNSWGGLLLFGLLVGCGDDSGQEPTDSGAGTTTAATDTTASTDTSETTSPLTTTDTSGTGSGCEGITCSDHGACVLVDGQASCECDDEYVVDRLECIPDVPVLDALLDLRLPEHAGVSRDGAPVRSGVPLPQGLLQPDDSVALFDGDQRLPTQTRPLSVWPDGSVRWLLIDAVASVDADATLSLSLKQLAEAAEIPDGIIVSVGGGLVSIDTGPMQVEIDAERGLGLSRVVVDGMTLLDPPSMGGSAERGPFTNAARAAAQDMNSALTAGDKAEAYLSYVSGSGMPALEFHRVAPWSLSVQVEEEGPLHTSVRVSGAQLDPEGKTEGLYTTRYHFYRGAPTIDVQHQWVYTGEGSVDTISSYGFDLPFASDARAAEGEAADEALLTHTAYDAYQRNGAPQVGQAAPVVQATSGDRGVAVMLRDMAETFPKRLVADAERIRVELYADSVEDWSLARYSNTLGAGENSGSSVGAQGMGTGDFARLRFTTQGFDASLLEEARAFDAGPLQLWATPSWYSDARVMGMGPFAFDADLGVSEVHYRIDRVLHVVEAWMRFNRDYHAWYGIEHYGDIRGWFYGGANKAEWRIEGRYGWSGNSGEPSNQLWHQCLRAQSRPCLDDALALAQHTMDQQMIHFGSELVKGNTEYNGTGHTRPFAVGSLHRHGMQPFSGFAEQPEYSHLGGVETYYYMTGDQAARDALYEAAQFIYRFKTDDLITTAAVNGVDVLSRAAAVEYESPEAATRFATRVDEMNQRLLEDDTLTQLLGSPTDLDFIRALRGPQYHAERTGDAAAAAVVLAAADVVVANDWGLCDDAGNASLKLVVSIVNHAVTVASEHGADPEPYRALAQCMLELASLSQDGESHNALSLDLLQALPTQLDQWQWVYEENVADSLLLVARQAAFRNDDMMGYHFYRNFEALMTGAAAISPDTPGLTPH